MTAVIIKDGGAHTPPRASSKDGEGYDRCPADGCVEVERIHKAGGVDGHGEEHLDWSMFSADRRQGGCGYVWANDTRQGTARAHAQGREPRWKTRAAETDRTMSVPSDPFRANYERAFATKLAPGEPIFG